MFLLKQGSLYLPVIARSAATKQSRIVRFGKGFGLLRFARNDNMMVFRGSHKEVYFVALIKSHDFLRLLISDAILLQLLVQTVNTFPLTFMSTVAREVTLTDEISL